MSGPSESLRDKKDAIIAKFSENTELKPVFLNHVWPRLESDYGAMVTAMISRCKAILSEDGILAKVEGRVKSLNSIDKSIERREEVRRKNSSKGFKDLHDIFYDIHDLAGLRIVVDYPSDLDRTNRLIKRAFEQHKPPNFFSRDRLVGKSWEAWFGAYESYNHYVTLRPEGQEPSLEPYRHVQFEIQLTSLPESLYARLNHPLLYKDPSSISRQDEMVIDLSHGLALCYSLCQVYMQDKLDKSARKHVTQSLRDAMMNVESAPPEEDVRSVSAMDALVAMMPAQLEHDQGQSSSECPATVKKVPRRLLIEKLSKVTETCDSTKDPWDKFASTMGVLSLELDAVHAAIGSMAVEVRQDLHQLTNDMSKIYKSGSDEDKCLHDLFVTDPWENREAIISNKGDICEGTCEWIHSEPQFRQWEETAPHLLWISAYPGMGKTHLSIYLSKYYENFAQMNPDTLVLYFFCDNKEETRNTPINLLRGLMFQLLTSQPDLLSGVLSLWKHQGRGLFASSFHTLWKSFSDMVSKAKASTVYCIMDGLDECKEGSLEDLLQKLSKLADTNVTSTANTKLKLICVSRRFPLHIQRHLKDFTHIQLEKLDARNADVEAFISQRVEDLARRSELNEGLCRRIEGTFKAKAEKSFLWVSFMQKDLQGKTEGEIEQALTCLPTGLGEVYDRILKSINTNSSKIKNMLGWILVAARPLRVSELCKAINLQSTELVDAGKILCDMVTSCGHLLQIRRNKSPLHVSTGDDSEYPPSYQVLEVTFLHQSAKDYITESIFLVPVAELYEPIVEYLLDTLCNGQGPRISNPLDHPDFPSGYSTMSTYAAQYWPLHFQKLELGRVGRIVRHYEEFLSTKSLLGHQRVGMKWDIEPVPLLHLACYHDLENLVRWILEQRGTQKPLRGLKQQRIEVLGHTIKSDQVLDVCWGWEHETALHVATKRGNDSIVVLLIRAGANPLVADGDDQNSFEYAIGCCQRPSWEALIQALSRTRRGQKWLRQQQPGGGGTSNALSKAIWAGDGEACGFLLDECNWDVNHSTRPLADAIEYGRIDLARELRFRRRASIDGIHGDLLRKAAFIYDTSSLERAMALLHDWDVDMDAGDGTHGEDGKFCGILCRLSITNAYGDAIFGKLQACIRAGVDPSVRNKNGCVFLHCAAEADKFPLLVLKHDLLQLVPKAHLNQACADGRTVLHHFLGRFATPDHYYRYLILAHGEAIVVNVFRRLIDLGADPSIKDHKGQSCAILLDRIHKTHPHREFRKVAKDMRIILDAKAATT